MMNHCANGCPLAHQHVIGCQVDGCRGCLPRPSDVGALCQRCYDRLETAIRTANEFAAHMYAIGDLLAITCIPSSDMPTRHGDPAEATVLHPATLDADEYMSLISSWAHVILEEHPNQPMRGPTAPPWNGDVTAWILPHLEWAAAQDWTTDMQSEIVRETARLHARWPTVDDTAPPRPVDIPCLSCNQISLIYIPARYHRQTFVIECINPNCGRLLDEPEWARLRTLWAKRVKHLEIA